MVCGLLGILTACTLLSSSCQRLLSYTVAYCPTVIATVNDSLANGYVRVGEDSGRLRSHQGDLRLDRAAAGSAEAAAGPSVRPAPRLLLAEKGPAGRLQAALRERIAEREGV